MEKNMDDGEQHFAAAPFLLEGRQKTSGSFFR
jgi:hypothetical protein